MMSGLSVHRAWGELVKVFSRPNYDRQGAVFCGKVRPLPDGGGSENDF